MRSEFPVRPKHLLAIGLALCLMTAAGAEALSGSTATKPDVQLSDLELGEHWFGPEVDLDALRGKVVLFEVWGS